jgi:hypothetical protein
MNEVRIRVVAFAVLGGSLLVAGCKSSPPTQSAAAPAGQSAPAGPPVNTMSGPPVNSMSGPQPAPAPAAEAGPPPAPTVTAPVGTPVVVRINATISSKTSDVGSGFTGVLERPVVSHGAVVFEKGIPVAGEVVASKGKGRFKGAGDLGIVVTEIGRHPVETSEYEKIDKGEGKRTGAFVGGGTGLGAVIGGIAGGGKGAVIGGLAGAGAGTAGAATGRRDVVIPAETVLTFRLEKAVSR